MMSAIFNIKHLSLSLPPFRSEIKAWAGFILRAETNSEGKIYRISYLYMTKFLAKSDDITHSLFTTLYRNDLFTCFFIHHRLTNST